MIYNLRDFFKDGGSATATLVEVMSRMNDGDTLKLGGGVYRLSPEGALRKTYYMSNNDGGEKPIVIPIIGKKGITVDGEGATLVFSGATLPIVIDESESICLKNLSIDYAMPMYAQAEIVEATDTRTVLRFDREQFFCRVDEDGNWCFFSPNDGWEHHKTRPLALQFDQGVPSSYSRPYFPFTGASGDHGFLGKMFLEVELSDMGDGLIAMNGDFKGFGTNHKVGSSLVMTYAGREFPGIFVNNSSDISLENITLFQTISMGLIAQMTENIRLHKVVAEPRRDLGRMLSTGADSTHFVNCRGKIELSHCRFTNMMDDACNVHGNYHLYLERKSENILLLGFGHHQQKGTLTYKKGDTVHLIDSETNELIAEAQVLKASLVGIDNIELTLDKAVPAPTNEHWVTENISTAPDVHIHHTEAGFNRPRGFLLSTRGKALVEKCKLFNMMQGIQLSGELCNWYESGAALDVTIRDNDFANSAYAGGVAIYSCPLLRATEKNPDIIYSGRLLVEGNRFEQADKRIMTVAHARDVIFRNNTFKKNNTLPHHAPRCDSGITAHHCGSVLIEDVKEI